MIIKGDEHQRGHSDQFNQFYLVAAVCDNQGKMKSPCIELFLKPRLIIPRLKKLASFFALIEIFFFSLPGPLGESLSFFPVHFLSSSSSDLGWFYCGRTACQKVRKKRTKNAARVWSCSAPFFASFFSVCLFSRRLPQSKAFCPLPVSFNFYAWTAIFCFEDDFLRSSHR